MTAVFAQLEPVVSPDLDWIGLLPVVVPAGGALLMLIVGALLARRGLPPVLEAVWTFVLAATGLVSIVMLWRREDDAIQAFEAQLIFDKVGLFAAAVILGSVAAVAVTLPGFCRRVGIAGSEAYVLLLLAATGAIVMVGAADLIVLFLGLETMSIAAYVMTALNMRRIQSLEAGLKYFVLGAFSTAFLLYGIALIYGATGSTNLNAIADFLRDNILLADAMLLAGLAMLLVGLGFKVAAVPFHAWAPDTYTGAPTPVTAFMASAVKTAGFVAIIRVFMQALGERTDDWQPAVFALACATLAVGSLLAVVQSDVKRLLAYSSISHAGFILVGVQAATDEGVSGVLFYLAVYGVIVIGSFTVLSVLSGPDDANTGMEAVDGLGARRPVLAIGFTILLLAQAGVPLTSGFVAKFSVIAAAVDARSYWLAVVAMVCAVIAAFAYLRVVVTMYFLHSPDSGAPSADGSASAGGAASGSAVAPRVGLGAGAVIAVAVVVTVVLGIVPGVLENLTSTAAGL